MPKPSPSEPEPNPPVIEMAELGERLAARRTTLAEFATEVEGRREAAGYPELPRNSGERRTESKKALLAAIAAAGGKW